MRVRKLLCGVLRRNTEQCSAVQCSEVQYSAVQRSAVVRRSEKSVTEEGKVRK